MQNYAIGGWYLGFMFLAMVGRRILRSNIFSFGMSVPIVWPRVVAPCFALHRWVYTIGEDEPELAVERCRWCRRIFQTARAASLHEQRCRFQAGERPAFECRKCGMRLARHFGRARRMAHEQYCRGTEVANLKCCNCGRDVCSRPG